MALNISAASTISPAINGLTSASANVDAANTADYFVEVLTPGANYVTESGFIYQDVNGSVPELSSILLTASSILALLRCKRLGRI